MNADLVAAVDEIDRVFGGFADPEVGACLHCYSEDDVAQLRVPDVELPIDLLSSFAYRTETLFDNYPSVVRRLLPQMCRTLATGELHAWWGYQNCLANVDWRSWPAAESHAIRGFIDTWWADTLARPEPTHRIDEVLAICISAANDTTGLLNAWPQDPVAMAHLADQVTAWLYDLPYYCPFFVLDEKTVNAAVMKWLGTVGADRLRAHGYTELADQCIAEMRSEP